MHGEIATREAMTFENIAFLEGFMSNVGNNDKIIDAFSLKRLEKAYGFSGENLPQALACQAWNMQLCAALYPLLQIVEILLRNSIHQALSKHFNNEHWFRDPSILQAEELVVVTKMLVSLEKPSKAQDPNYVVSELSFGFWVDLLSLPYQQTLWNSLLLKVFPHISNRNATRNIVFNRLSQIRKLRNRIFHHQQIWQLPALSKQKESILHVVSWIEPEVLAYCKSLDKFDEIYSAGLSA